MRAVKGMAMNPADIYCFSGTGNTWVAAQRMTEVLEREGAGARLLRLEKSDPVKIDPARTLGIAFPIAAFGTYPVVTQFLDRLPCGNGAAVFLLDTMGGNSFHYPARLYHFFAAKGYRPVGACELIMPDNLLCLRINEEKNRRVIEAALAKAEDFARGLITGSAQWAAGASAQTFADRLNRGAFSSRIARYLMKPSVHYALCTGCGLCVQHCPTGCLQMERGKAVMSGTCQFCQRCRGICPAGAIRLGPGKRYAASGWREVLNG